MAEEQVEITKLTDWENAPTISDLKQNLDDADNDHTDHQLDVDRWIENRNMEGAAKPKKIKGRSSVAPKIIRKHAEWRYSSLSAPFLSDNVLFSVSPSSAGDRKRAQQNALVLNHQFNNYVNKVKFIDDLVRDDVDLGTAIVEVMWVTEEEEVTEDVPVYSYEPSQDQQVAQQYMQLLQMKQSSRDLYEQYMNPGLDKAITIFAQMGQLVVPKQIGTEQVTRIQETKNYPSVEVCESANIIIDPSCNGDLSKAQFIIKKHKASLSMLRKDGKYQNLKAVMVAEADPLANPDYEEGADIQSFSFKDEPRQQFVVHTYWGNWDINNTGIAVPIVASWVGNVMIRMEENPFPFKHPPFAKAVYMPVRQSSYGEPDGELLEENQQIIGATTRGMIDIMGKSANGQTGTKQGFLNATNKRKFVRGDNYEFNATGDPRQAVYQHTYPEIPQSAYSMIAMQNSDAESLTGVKAFSSGITSKALGDSVGGGRDVMDAASKREADILRRLKECLKEVGKMFISMNAVFLSDEEVVRITDEQFVVVRRDDLSGHFDLVLSISTPEKDDKRAQELSFMLQTTGNNMDPGLHNMILSDIARLREMPTLSKRIEEYKPTPDPMQQKEMELKLMLLEAQIAKEQALTAKHTSEAQANGYRGAKDGSQAQLNSAKATTESAKVRNLHSDSDQKDLDYLEKHSGVNHQRALDMEDKKASNEIIKESVKGDRS